MAQGKIKVDDSLVDLHEFRSAWVGIRKPYHGQDPDLKPSDAGWDELTALSLICNNGDTESFANAWADTLLPARQLFLGRFTNWAIRLVKRAGIDRFPIDCGDPREIPGPQREGIDGSLAQMLTGTSDPSAAGLRIMLWAAAYREPALCHRTLEYREILFFWVEQLLNFGDGICWTRREPFDWVHTALISLNSRPNKKRWTLCTVEHMVTNLLRTWKNVNKKPTLRKIASQIGCSTGLVSKTPAWREHMNSISSTSDTDPELQKLIAEQQADEARDRSRRGRRLKA